MLTVAHPSAASTCCEAFQIASDLNNGSEFVAKAVQEWITAIGAKTAYIEPAQGKRLPAPPATLTHARLSDFIVDAAAAFIGLGLTSAAARFSRYKIRL